MEYTPCPDQWSEIIRQLEDEVTQLKKAVVDLEEQVVMSYEEGYLAGFSKAERAFGGAGDHIEILDWVRKFIKDKGYVFANHQPSSRGLKQQDILLIYAVICRGLGIEFEYEA